VLLFLVEIHKGIKQETLPFLFSYSQNEDTFVANLGEQV
jgi:hypothetical protein